MRTLTTTADQIQPGDTITHVEGSAQTHPGLVIATTPGWLTDSIYAEYLTGGFKHLLLNDAAVTVDRPDTDDDKQAVAKKAYEWMLLLVHNPFGHYDGPNHDHLALLWTMYGRDGEMDDTFAQEIQDRLDADYDERCTIPPC